ncbi:MAG: hypothetical protein FJY88_00990 [Candidatus Eisenbacteria bacterium]|nr:hypothetical protein [Candidatus Eisenbacteria bacterium]
MECRQRLSVVNITVIGRPVNPACRIAAGRIAFGSQQGAGKGQVAEEERTPDLASAAVANAVTAILPRISGLAVAIFLTPFVLGHLGQALYGVLVAVGSLYEYLSVLRGGMGAALRRYVTVSFHAGKREQAREYYAAGFWWGGVFRTFIFLLGLSLAEPLCHFLNLPAEFLHDGAWGVALILTAAIIGDAALMLDIPIYVTGRTARLSVLRTFAVWSKLAITVLAFHFFVPSLRVLGGAAIVIEAIPLLVMIWMSQKAGTVGAAIPRPRFGRPEVRRELFRYGGLALLSQAAALLYISTDNLLIGRIYGTAAVTHYSLGARWSPFILSFLVTAVYALTPLFTRLDAQGESERSRSALLRVVGVTSALAVPACLVPCVVSDMFLVHWVGPEYRRSAVYMIAMLAPSMLDAALAPIWMALTARGRIGWITAGELIVALGNVALSLVLALVFHLELLGFALGNTAALLAKNLLLRPLASRRDPDVPSAREFLGPLGRAFAGGLPALVLLYITRGLYDGSLAQVVIAGFAGGAICLAGSSLAALGPKGVRSVIDILRRELMRRRPAGF